MCTTITICLKCELVSIKNDLNSINVLKYIIEFTLSEITFCSASKHIPTINRN